MDTNTTQVIQEFGNKIDGYVQTMATKAGMAVDHFWPVFIQQQQIRGYSYFICWTIFMIIAFSLTRLYRKLELWEDNERSCFTCIGIVLMLVGLFNLFICFGEYYGYIVNPEYAALQEVVKMIK